jgi:hypothetical protein
MLVLRPDLHERLFLPSVLGRENDTRQNDTEARKDAFLTSGSTHSRPTETDFIQHGCLSVFLRRRRHLLTIRKFRSLICEKNYTT